MTDQELERLTRFNDLVANIERDIRSIESIYRSIGMFDEARTRLAQRIAHKILEGEYAYAHMAAGAAGE